MKSDQIRRMLTITSDNIKRLSLYFNQDRLQIRKITFFLSFPTFLDDENVNNDSDEEKTSDNTDDATLDSVLPTKHYEKLDVF
jgi:hypothetical protein